MKSRNCSAFGSGALAGAVEGLKTGSVTSVDWGAGVVEAKRVDVA